MKYKISICVLFFVFIHIINGDSNKSELVFIYNAKSGIIISLIDFIHKVISPDTYECNLYAITYGTFAKKDIWEDYIESLPISSIFTYKDKILDKKLDNVILPAVFQKKNDRFIQLISSVELNKLNNLQGLITLLNSRLKENGVMKKEEKIITDEEWKNKLTSAEYHILREKGTERPFTGKYDEFFEDGRYRCAGCDEELFISETKYNSGCGWPAFYESLPNKIEESEDNSFGMKRIEITCKNCGGHLGHVFNDGPKPTGLRYCINSASLDFEPEKDND
tara:strand:+ start:24 stop:860 length:837 start_codon:yes stop_codon:yes gene_type:complete